MTSAETRLRKYRRKKTLAFRACNPKLVSYLTLYWRYHFKVHGAPIHLWGSPKPAPQKKAKR